MLGIVYLAIVTLATAQETYKELDKSEENSKLFVKSLRRQLMRDNYDYSREEINNTRKHDFVDRDQFKWKTTRKNFYVTNLGVDEIDKESNFSYDMDEHKKDGKAIDHVVYKKDLLYYIDDEKLTTQKSEYETTAKYKILKVKHQYRRSGKARLIQEEGKEGIAIVNLDKGPIPVMRLPNSRRQFMHDHGEAITDEEEVPPPSVNTSDPEAAAEDFENIATTKIPNNSKLK